MDKTIRLGIIGAGAIARKHLEVIKDIDWIEPIGITSRTREKAQQLASEYGISICADDIDLLIKKISPDALLVLVSADQIFTVVSKAIPYKLPLFIEKPPGLTPDDTKNLVELAQKYSVYTMVGFNRRYYSIFHKGIKIILEHGPLMGVLIEGHERIWLRPEQLPEYIRSNWIFANATHTIDLLRFFGGEPEKVMSLAHRYTEARGDQFATIIEFESGAIGNYCAHWYSPGGWRVVLFGEGVTVEFSPLETGFWTDKNFKTYKIEPDEVDRLYKPGFYRQMEAFGRLVSDGEFSWPILDLEGAYKTMLLAEKISSHISDKSATEGSKTLLR